MAEAYLAWDLVLLEHRHEMVRRRQIAKNRRNSENPLLLEDNEFLGRYRVSKEMFNELVDELRPSLQRQRPYGLSTESQANPINSVVPEETSQESSPDIKDFNVEVAGKNEVSEGTLQESRIQIQESIKKENEAMLEDKSSDDLPTQVLLQESEMSPEVRAMFKKIKEGKLIIASQEYTIKKQKEKIAELELRNSKLTKRNIFLKGMVRRLKERILRTDK